MNILSKTMICAALVLATTSVSFAGNINQRERNQVHRIYRGIANGELSFAEFLKLAKAQVMIRQLEKQARASGSINAVERFAINQALKYQSVLIYNQKHD
jgi:hypothetical protein